MKYSFVILTCFIAAFIATNNSMNAQTQKIGYVDTEVILKQLPEAQEADKKLKDIATKFQDTLVAMQKFAVIIQIKSRVLVITALN